MEVHQSAKNATLLHQILIYQLITIFAYKTVVVKLVFYIFFNIIENFYLIFIH